MDWTGLAAVIVALGGSGTAAAIWKAAKSSAKNELLAEQAQATIAEKDKELERLWLLLESLTNPEVKT